MGIRYKVVIFILVVVNIMLSTLGILYSRVIKNINDGFYLLGNNNIVLEFGDKYEEAGYVAKIYEKDHIKDVVINSDVNINKLGDYEISYTLNFLNYKKVLTRQIKIVDTNPPELDLKCDLDQYVVINNNAPKCEVIASDNYDQDLTDKIIVDSNVDTNRLGDYTVTYSVKDSSDNETTKTVKVYVRNKSDLYYVNVFISKQRLDYYENNKVVLTTPITSGAHNATKTGNFTIKNKARDTTLKGADYVSFVKYWMGYGGGYGLHDASWRSRFGTSDYFTRGSHGCINMPTNAAKELYDKIEVGTPVHIQN